MPQTRSRQSESTAPAIVWFRSDLRLADNPALSEALNRRAPVIPLFIWAPEEEGDWPPGGASRWWLHQSLAALQSRLDSLGSRLILRRGHSRRVLREVAGETGAAAVYWNRRYEPGVRDRDAQIEQSLRASGITVQTFNGALLHEPSAIRNSSGKPFQVFTAFWKHCVGLPGPGKPLPGPELMPTPKSWPRTARLEELALEPRPDWASGLRETWAPGEAGAARRLGRFLNEALADYEIDRNRPDLAGTSKLSPHLSFGEISPRHVWWAVTRELAKGPRESARRGRVATHPAQTSQFLSELGWREFAHHLLFHFPLTPAQPLRAEFSRFQWRTNPAALKAWQRGSTGYPIVDAGMRELWTTGWMHNRVRMIVASFLVKDLLISWEEGARWFWDTLVDASLAQNTFNWQWCAGCGADAAPFFRVFNPVRQAEKFDPAGRYIRRWVPELTALPDQWIHKPHLAPSEALTRWGIRLDSTYPRPVVNHLIAREVAIEAYRRARPV